MNKKCPECGSGNLQYHINKNRVFSPDQFMRFPGHCVDCGYSFTAIFELKLIEFTDRR